jgi:heme-degrading monooxygenase HmoA
MDMRLVQLVVKNGTPSLLREHYTKRVIPVLKEIAGCRYAGLMQSVHHPEQCISLTLWDSHAHSEGFERSGVFQQLIDEAKPLLSESSEYRMQLSEDLTLEYVPVPLEPVVRSYSVAERSTVDENRGPATYLRIVSLKILPGKLDEFRRLYVEHSIPALRKVEGCRYVYLLEGDESNHEVFSVTSWDSPQDAERYEKSGLYEQLLHVQLPTLAGLYQWKARVGKDVASRSATSEDVMVEQYSILAFVSQ